MKTAQQRMKERAELTELITATCKSRHDTEEHRKACINETLKQPDEDRAYWLWYWAWADPKTWDTDAVIRGAHP